MTLVTRFSISVAASAVLMGVAPAYAAPKDAPAAETANDKTTCEQAFEQAQRDQNDAHYLSATKQALLCSNPKCGDAIDEECARMYTALEQATPSVVVAARDATKAIDLNEVEILIDGQPASDHLDGRPILVDPGAHTFKFTAANYVPDERQVMIRAGEKYRQISVMLTPLQTEASLATPVAAAPAGPPPAPATRKVPIASFILGGFGIAALGGGVALRLIGGSDYDQLKTSCQPNCTASQVSSVKLKYQLSDVAIGVGAAAFAGAIVIYAVAPKHSETTTAFLLAPTPGGFSAGLVRPF